jgi:hypothetical protein
MFIYYMNSLHRHHEQSLLLGKKTSEDCIAIWAHMVDGHFQMAMALLNPVTLQLSHDQPVATWEMLPDEQNHKHLAMHWLAENKAKVAALQHTLFAVVEHQTAGWNVITNELLTKLQNDSPQQFKELLAISKQSVQQASKAEAATIKAVEDALTVPVKKAPAKRSAPKSTSGVNQ